MTAVDLRHALAIATCSAAALLSACGGSPAVPAGLDGTVTALSTPVNAPQADCEADGCRAPRIVDGLAEQYRAAALAPPAAPPDPSGAAPR